jgi:type II secretion system protein N
MRERLIAMREVGKRLLPRVGYPAVYVLCLVLFSSWTFPYGKLKDHVVGAFDAQQRGAGSRDELEIDDMGSSWITGVKMKGIRLSSPPSDPSKPPSEMKIDEATVRVSLLSLLVGNRDVSFYMAAFGGNIDGALNDRGEKERSLSAKLEAIDVSLLAPLVDLIGLPLDGKLSGTIRIDMPEGKASKATGSVSLETDGLAIGDGKAKLKGALALPRLNVGTLSLVGDAKDGVLRVTKFGATGHDVEVQGDGRIQLREVPTESNCELNVRFKINDAYRTKNDMTKSLFGAPGSNAPALFELADARFKQSKRPDGFYAWRARGMLTHLDFSPATGGGVGMPTRP